MSDLEVGDHLGPLDQVVSAFLVREYAHAVEEASERHQGVAIVATPTLMHAFKKRLMEHACPLGVGPTARMHLVYDAVCHRPIPGGTTVVLAAEITGRYEKRGRERMEATFEVRDKTTVEAYMTYYDTTLLSYRSNA
jgi:hypothetical protein